MDPSERDRIDRADRKAEQAKALAHARAIGARDARPLIVMVAAALFATAVILGVMWVNSPRYDGASSRPVAEQQQRQ